MSTLDRPFLKTTEVWLDAGLARFRAHGYEAINCSHEWYGRGC